MDFKELIQTLNNSMAIELPEQLSLNDLHSQLSQYINQLIQNNFENLIVVLYRIDVSETKLKQLLQEHAGEDAGKIIATLIIERQIQKIERRKQNKPGTDIPEMEKW